MKDYVASTYGDRIAEIYDDLYGGAFDVEATVELLATLAGAGPVLELAIGTRGAAARGTRDRRSRHRRLGLDGRQDAGEARW